jgi:hypothetical protein
VTTPTERGPPAGPPRAQGAGFCWPALPESEARGGGREAYLSGICHATKRDGSPCTLPSNGPEGLCWAHDPKNAAKRRRGQSKGGRNKPSRELGNIKERLSNLAEDVLAGEVDKGVGAVVSQILNVYLRAVSVELDVQERQDLLTRMEALEEALQARDERGGYGA